MRACTRARVRAERAPPLPPPLSLAWTRASGVGFTHVEPEAKPSVPMCSLRIRPGAWQIFYCAFLMFCVKSYILSMRVDHTECRHAPCDVIHAPLALPTS